MRSAALFAVVLIAAAAADGTAGPRSWTLRVCRAATAAEEVRAVIEMPGRPGGDSMKEVWAVWKKDDATAAEQEYEVPPTFSDNTRITTRLAGAPPRRHVHAAVFFAGEARRVFDFESEDGAEIGYQDPTVEWRCGE